MGSASTTSSASPIRGGVAPRGKRITPCPEKMLGVVTPYHYHSLETQMEWIGSLDFGSSVQTRRMLGWGKTNHPSSPSPYQA